MTLETLNRRRPGDSGRRGRRHADPASEQPLLRCRHAAGRQGAPWATQGPSCDRDAAVPLSTSRRFIAAARWWRLASRKPRSWVGDHSGSLRLRRAVPTDQAAKARCPGGRCSRCARLVHRPLPGRSRASCASPAGPLRVAGGSGGELRSLRGSCGSQSSLMRTAKDAETIMSSSWGPALRPRVFRKGLLGVRTPSLSRFFAKAGRSSPSRPLLASSIASRSNWSKASWPARAARSSDSTSWSRGRSWLIEMKLRSPQSLLFTATLRLRCPLRSITETLLLGCRRAASDSAPCSPLPSTLSSARSRARACAEGKPAGRHRAPGRARARRGRARSSA